MDHIEHDNLVESEIPRTSNSNCHKEARLVEFSGEDVPNEVKKIPRSKGGLFGIFDDDMSSKTSEELSGLDSHNFKSCGTLQIISPTGFNKIVLQRASSDTNDEDSVEVEPEDLPNQQMLLSNFSGSHQSKHTNVARCRSAGLQTRPSPIMHVNKNKSIDCANDTTYLRTDSNPIPRRPKLGIIRGLSRQKRTDSGDEDPSTVSPSPWRVSFNLPSEIVLYS
jgi:hypothetical protein